MVGPKKEDFWPKMNILKGNSCILSVSIIGHDFRKVVQKLKLEKKCFGLLN